MVYFLSQLQVIDRNLYEAARIDGARPYQILTRITLPLMRPAFAFVLVTQMVGGLLIFDIIFTVFLVGLGTFGPGDSAKTFMLYIYYNAFAASPPKLGLASAAGWFVFLIIFIINIIQMRIIGLGTSRGEE
jgi:ABC-type sugar transport system permease subunit